MTPKSILRVSEGLGAFLVSMVNFAFFDPVRTPLLTDIRYFVYFAWQVAEGATPYLELFDPKTPLSIFAGAMFYQWGSSLGADPLIAIRIGYLVLAASGGWLAFEVMRIIGGGRLAAGVLGLFAYCSFGALGELPAIGNIPKLLMALFGAATGLLCYKRHFLAAGVTGALAFLDWQIGITAWIGAMVAAVIWGQSRPRAIAQVALGGFLGLAPFAIYFSLRGGLTDFFDQTLFAAFFRGSDFAVRKTLPEHLEHVGVILARTAGDQWWLLLAGAMGACVAICWLWTRRNTRAAPLLVVLCVYHFSILGFSVIDFQARGDAFAVLHSVVFFLGILWVAIYEKADALARRNYPGNGRRIVTALLLLLVFVAARPGPFRSDNAWLLPDVSLAEQREVASRVAALVGDRTLVAVEMSEILVLLEETNPVPFIYWNAASWHRYRESNDEGPRVALERLLEAARADAWIVSAQPDRPKPMRIRLYGLKSMGPEWEAVTVSSATSEYAVQLYLR